MPEPPYHYHKIDMRSRFLLLLGISLTYFLSTSAKMLDGVANTNPLTKTNILNASEPPNTSTRLLRLPTTTHQDHEDVQDKLAGERAGLPGMTKLDDLAYKLALKVETNPIDIFKGLRAAKTGGKLEGDKGFLRWLLYVKQYRVKRGGGGWFSDGKLFDLLRKTKPEAELVTLFQSLRGYPNFKDIADKMQSNMILISATSHKLTNEAWLKARETPQQVFDILRLGDETLQSLGSSSLFIHWLRYIKAHRASIESESFSDLDTLRFLQKRKPFTNEFKFGNLFQPIKDTPDLDDLLKGMQTHLYRKWMRDHNVDPNELARQLGVPYSLNFRIIPKRDPRYQNFQAYTMHFAEQRGGAALLEQVKKLFADNEPYAALTAA